MTKQKKSFFEKLTGIQKIDDESEVEITNSTENKKEIPVENDSYDFSLNKNQTEDDFFQEKESEPEEAFQAETITETIDEEVVAPEPEEIKKPAPIEKDNEDDVEVDSEGQLTIDVYQTDKDIVIKSTIAGVRPEDLDVDINSEMVTIKGKRTQEEEIDSENYYYQECYWGPFSRSIILPVEIVTEKAEASMKNGILTIRLPKLKAAKTRKLQVRGF
jgi:HSP20 family protein